MPWAVLVDVVVSGFVWLWRAPASELLACPAAAACCLADSVRPDASAAHGARSPVGYLLHTYLPAVVGRLLQILVCTHVSPQPLGSGPGTQYYQLTKAPAPRPLHGGSYRDR